MENTAMHNEVSFSVLISYDVYDFYSPSRGKITIYFDKEFPDTHITPAELKEIFGNGKYLSEIKKHWEV